jgi:phosphate transport system permease protein
MAMVILPMIVVVTREALRSVPWSYREAAMGVGSTRWQAVKSQVLPVAKGGIFTGLFLSVGRAMGETAPLIMVGAAYYVSRFPKGVMDQYTVLPMQIFSWASDARREFHSDAAAATLVLMAVLLAVNGLVLWVRNRKSQAQSDSLL